MELLKKINYFFYPCQKGIDEMMRQHNAACDMLKKVVPMQKSLAQDKLK